MDVCLLTIFLLNMIFYINYGCWIRTPCFYQVFGLGDLLVAVWIGSGCEWRCMYAVFIPQLDPDRLPVDDCFAGAFWVGVNWQWSDFSHASDRNSMPA
jgi:hypothetical protein